MDGRHIEGKRKRYDWGNVACQLRQHFEEICAAPGKRRSRVLLPSNER